jgi:hypothetical protein
VHGDRLLTGLGLSSSISSVLAMATGDTIKPTKTAPFGRLVPNPKDVTTPPIYAHLMQRPGLGVRSPLDG